MDPTSTHPHSTTTTMLEKQRSMSDSQNFARLCQLRAATTTMSAFRRSILPVFPELNDGDEFYPLLTNIPNEELSDEEQVLRTVYLYHSIFMDQPPSPDDEIAGDIRNALNYYSRQWNIDQTVLIINLNRLFTIIPRLTLKDFILKQQEQLYKLSIKEWFIALEFYLQMDVDCFFMKTCALHHLKGQSKQDNLFSMNLLETHYGGMKQCRDTTCRVCYERLDLTKRFERAMHFTNNQIHRFVNHYQVYLNCDVTCTTSNIIYALTCPCHQYDYIGRCQGSFRDRMWQHRMNGCRWMSNFLLGSIVADRIEYEREHNPRISDNHIKLYQHSTQCSVALQLFLTCHPSYWCFVPMTDEQARFDNMNITSTERSILVRYQTHDSEQIEETTSPYHRDATYIRWCVDHVPQPPPNYQFSLRQKSEQWEFFQHRLDLYPSRFLDLYNASIIIALPEHSSDELRHLIHALLIVHAEPSLNVTIHSNEHGRELSDNAHDVWHQHLIHPRVR